MRIVKGPIDSMESPIRHVMYHIHEAIVNIAPERISEFDEKYPELVIVYLDSPDWTCEVIPNYKYFRLSRRVMEVLWCAAYGYMTFYQKIIQGNYGKSQEIISLHEDDEVKAAMNLLKWAFENWLKNEDAPWPDDLPRPVKSPKTGTMENVADELSLCAAAFYLHHELSHLRLKEEEFEDSIALEEQADFQAADWILNNDLDETDDKFIKRAMGIALGLEVMTAESIYSGFFGGIDHPRTYDRLINTLRNHIEDENHIVWGVVISTLKLHLDNMNIATPSIVYDSFLQGIESYANLLGETLAAKQKP